MCKVEAMRPACQTVRQDGRVTHPLLDQAGIDDLRAALLAAGYTSKGVADRLGPAAVQAIQRGDFRPALRATADTDPLATLIRLFICGQSVAESVVAAALPLTPARRAGLIHCDDHSMRAGAELEPYGDWWIISDLSTTLRPDVPLPADHVLGVGGASSTLAQATVRDEVGTALDLGTGCGVQALHLSSHAGRVTATDVSERALRFAATTAALNGLEWDLRLGDLAEPVAGARFDLVVSNPPFVVGPGAATHTYRDSGRPGDALCAELVRAAPALLAPGGTMQFLANWAHVTGEDWEERVAGWLAGTGLSAWVIQREVSDPVAYVNLWLSDANVSDPRRKIEWLDWFDANKIEAVGLGLITLRADGHRDPTVRLEDLRQPVDQPFGPHIAAWFTRQDWLRAHPAPDMLAARLRVTAGVTLRQDATLGDDGWQVDRQRLAQTTGLHWVDDVDPVTLALVGGCDGRLTLGAQLELLAAAHDVDLDVLTEAAVPLVAHLVERDFLVPVP
jgi:methylase of polypeptide subunit release factors